MASNFMARIRAVSVLPDTDGSVKQVSGSEIQINNESVPELDLSYFFNENFALETILGTATHSVSAKKVSSTTVDLGSVTLLPATIMAQFHFKGPFCKPYLGVGLNYTAYFGEQTTGSYKDISYDSKLGYALQFGADYEISKDFFINLDIKKYFMSTDVTVTPYSGSNLTAEVDINPLLLGFGIGHRF